MADLLTQAEMIKKLNKRLPKELMPRSGKITSANFSMKLRDGKFTHSDMKGASKLYDWDSVAPAFGIQIESKAKTAVKAKARVEVIKEQLGISETTIDDAKEQSMMEEFLETLKERLGRATTSKQEIEIEKMSYEALTKQLEARKRLEELIEVEDANATIEYILSNVKSKFYELPAKLKTRFPHIKDTEITEIHSIIDDIFRDLSTDVF
ncbi:MAG: hypothetical protein RBR50_00975 [Candidatus Izemoplasmatales bacterium]|nr:hypothetical protein [Candidatus Izemoplasmatales bacterium]